MRIVVVGGSGLVGVKLVSTLRHRRHDVLAASPRSGVDAVTGEGLSLKRLQARRLSSLADCHPNARLLGDGTAQGRADVLRWLDFLNSDVHPAFKPIFKPSRFHPDAAFASVIADTARTHVREYLEQLDAHLKGRNWLANDRLIADPYVFVLLRWTIRLKIDSSGLDNLDRFLARMYADAGVRAAVIAEEGPVDTTSPILSEQLRARR